MRDFRNEFIQNLRASASGYLDPGALEHVIADAMELLDSYELSERSTDLIVPEDINARLHHGQHTSK